MTSNTSKCPYCRRRYQQAGAYQTHLQTMHPDIVLFLRETPGQNLPGRTVFVPGENANQATNTSTHQFEDESDSDYESDPGLEDIDWDSAGDEMDNDIQHDSDAEDSAIPRPPDMASPLSRQTIPGAGRTIGNVSGYTELNQAMEDDPWSPFSSEEDFNLASWFVQSKIAKSQTKDYFAKGLSSRHAGSFRSAYTLRKQLVVLDRFGEYRAWTEATVNDWKHDTTFY